MSKTRAWIGEQKTLKPPVAVCAMERAIEPRTRILAARSISAAARLSERGELSSPSSSMRWDGRAVSLLSSLPL